MKKIVLAMFCLSTFIFAKEVTVSILPQKYFVEKIAGDKIDVNVMVKPGASPATYEPKVSQMRKLANSDIYFSIGVPFEKVWLEKFANANKKMMIVDTGKGINKIEMVAHSHDHEEHDEHKEEKHDEHKHDEHAHEKHDDHEHHDEHKEDKHEEHAHEKHDDHGHHDEHKEDKHDDDHEGHDHTGLDPHIWLEPTLVKIQAKNIYEAVAKIDSKNESFYKANYEKFIKELDALDHKIKDMLKPYAHKAFMVFHPSWGYFSKRYDLEQISIEIQGKEPKPAQLVELVKEAKLHDIKIVFVAPQFSQKGAKTISKSINGNVATMNPLALKWDENLLKVAKEIANSYK